MLFLHTIVFDSCYVYSNIPTRVIPFSSVTFCFGMRVLFANDSFAIVIEVSQDSIFSTFLILYFFVLSLVRLWYKR